MKPVILGPSFKSTNEPENHPLSDFKMHMLIDFDSYEGYSPFVELRDDTEKSDAIVDSANNMPLNICFEPDKSKSPLYRREIDKVQHQNRQELVNVSIGNSKNFT